MGVLTSLSFRGPSIVTRVPSSRLGRFPDLLPFRSQRRVSIERSRREFRRIQNEVDARHLLLLLASSTSSFPSSPPTGVPPKPAPSSSIPIPISIPKARLILSQQRNDELVRSRRSVARRFSTKVGCENVPVENEEEGEEREDVKYVEREFRSEEGWSRRVRELKREERALVFLDVEVACGTFSQY